LVTAGAESLGFFSAGPRLPRAASGKQRKNASRDARSQAFEYERQKGLFTGKHKKKRHRSQRPSSPDRAALFAISLLRCPRKSIFRTLPDMEIRHWRSIGCHAE